MEYRKKKGKIPNREDAGRDGGREDREGARERSRKIRWNHFLPDTDKLTLSGEKMGYTGEDLKQFVKTQRDLARDERAAQRKYEKEALVLQLRIEELRKENAAKGIKTEHASTGQGKAKFPNYQNSVRIRMTLMLTYKDLKGAAESNKWERDDWALNLSALLHGKGLDTYARLAPTDTYDVLKSELLKAYQMTEDGFRSKFRSAKAEQTESAPQFATRLENYLIRWVELAAVTKNFAGLSDLLIREQFVAGCNKDMALFLKERKPKNVAGMTQLAEQYIEARGGWNASFGGKLPHQKGQQPSGKKTNTNPPTHGTNPKQSTNTGGNQRRCFICDKVGHMAKDCYRRTRPTLKAASLQGSASHGHKSGKQGKKLNQTDTSSSLCTACSCESCGQNRVQTASSCVLVSNEMYGEGVKSGDAYVTMSCGHKLPLASAACSDNLVEDMPVVQGFLCNKEVQVMRDSGCDAVAVRKRLVPEEKFTGVYDKCRLIDGTVRTFPVACLDVDTPYFTGHVHALVMNDPVYDLILGNNLRETRSPFILTVVDYATRFPEAVPLRNIDSISVAEALLDIYSRVGFPREVLSDQGRQFTSEVMAEVNRLLSIRQLTTTAWHPMTNGMCERFNGVLKASLRKMCEERPRDWDRETPHASTGFSPFDLLYGRSVRGPLGMLKEFWTGQIEEPETKTTFEYVLDLQDRLQKTCDLAREEMKKSQGKYKMYYDRKAKARKFDVGDEVLLLLPTDHNKLLLHWKGPFPVVGKVGSMDYKVDFGTKVKTFHANLLKKYFRRDTDQPSKVVAGLLQIACSAIIESEVQEESEMSEEDDVSLTNEDLLQIPSFQAEETIADVHINQDLTEEQSLEVKRLLGNYSSVLTDKPGFTHLGSHDIKLTDSTPLRTKPYPIPYALRDSVKEEIKTMLELDVIEPSTSPYASPLVVVKKADGKNRICCDTRKINAITEFDAEGIPSPREIFDQLGDAQYFSKLDLSKGYWQVPLTENAKPLTAFLAFDQLYQYRRMPFGLVNAPATFSRIMRKLLNNFDKVVNYIDDILVYTVTWDEHLEKLNELMKRLRDANLTAKPSKCYIGFERVEFLGHTVEKGCRHPNLDKLEVIQKAPRPVTKTQLKSFLGLAGFYRQYIPNFGAIAVPLTDKPKAGEPTKINWERSQELAFQTLKSMLGKAPILHLPDFHRQFILRTDAIDVAIGAVLFQEFEGVKFPLAYLSKKLNKAQRGYAIMEKECLAVVWAIRKLELYLYGRDFVLETDHQPLLCVKRSKVANGGIMRWALSLQPYHYRIEAIKGSDNIGADYMSRISHE
ncbi:uncharacterized protein [Amphiura filiformis]|uniref:uncharacterized protein n=1 Tax=Amphiura filiformis TaxID=82378 RepID=UPI003B22058D